MSITVTDQNPAQVVTVTDQNPPQAVTVNTLLDETYTYRDRVEADGGEVIDFGHVDNAIRALKDEGVYGSAQFVGDANMGVKRDSNDAVATLYDASGNSNDATQSTQSKKPVLSTSADFNGRKALIFDGSDDFLQLSADPFATVSGGVTIWATFRYQGSGRMYFYNWREENDVATLTINDSRDAIGVFASDLDGVTLVAGSPTLGTDAKITAALVDGTSVDWRENGGAVTESTSKDGFDVADFGEVAPGSLYNAIGAFSVNQIFSSQDFATLILLNAPATTANSEAIETALNDYYQAY